MGLPAKDQDLCTESKVRPHLTWQDTQVGAGLDNLGNTCYMNVILQCLSHLPPLADHFLRGRYLEKVAPARTHYGAEFDNDDILGAMQKHIEQAHRGGPGTKGRQAIKPTVFFDNLTKIGEKFRQGRQEDVHEFLRHLVDKMAGGFLRRQGVEAMAASSEAPLEASSSATYAATAATLSTFLDLSMNLESATNSYGVARRVKSVPEALKRLTCTETLGSGNEWRCGGCKRLVEVEKRLTVSKPPKALVIQLKRFSFGGAATKIKDHSQLKLEVSRLERPVVYDLSGVVVHAGKSLSRGHFYAYVLSSTGCWAKMDDNVVTKVDLKAVMADKAYILFYSRRPVLLPLVASVSSSPKAGTAARSNCSSWTGTLKAAAPVSTVTEQAGGAHPTTTPASGAKNSNGGAPALAQSKRSRKRERAAAAVEAASRMAVARRTPATAAALVATAADPAATSSSSTKPRVTVGLSGSDGVAAGGNEGARASSHSAHREAAELPATPTSATDTAPTSPPTRQGPPCLQPEARPSVTGVGEEVASERPAGEDEEPDRGGAVPTVSPSISPRCDVVEPLSLDAPDVAAGKLSEKKEMKVSAGASVLAPWL